MAHSHKSDSKSARSSKLRSMGMGGGQGRSGRDDAAAFDGGGTMSAGDQAPAGLMPTSKGTDAATSGMYRRGGEVKGKAAVKRLDRVARKGGGRVCKAEGGGTNDGKEFGEVNDAPMKRMQRAERDDRKRGGRVKDANGGKVAFPPGSGGINTKAEDVKEVLKRRADKPLMGDKPQKDMDAAPLFNDSAKQGSLFKRGGTAKRSKHARGGRANSAGSAGQDDKGSIRSMSAMQGKKQTAGPFPSSPAAARCSRTTPAAATRSAPRPRRLASAAPLEEGCAASAPRTPRPRPTTPRRTGPPKTPSPRRSAPAETAWPTSRATRAWLASGSRTAAPRATTAIATTTTPTSAAER
jgi:hypothetical protein